MLAGLLVATVLILMLFALNWRRAKKETEYELTPNCLLTRHPIVFLTGRRSLLYFLSYWNEIPAFLTAHGYQIYVMPLPWKAPSAKKFLKNYFNRRGAEGQRYHFVIDSSLYSTMEEVLQDGAFARICSVSCVGHLQTQEVVFKKSLKGLPIPIEDIDLPLIDQKQPWWWSIHLMLTGQSQSTPLSNLGWPFVRTQYEVFLQRAAALAERDLIQGG